MGLGTLGKAGLIGVALGTLVFGAYAACKGERAALDGETPGKQYALDILTHGAKGGLILGSLGILRALRRASRAARNAAPDPRRRVQLRGCIRPSRPENNTG